MTVIDADTGEVVAPVPSLRTSGPMTVELVSDQCRTVEVWADQPLSVGSDRVCVRATPEGRRVVAAIGGPS